MEKEEDSMGSKILTAILISSILILCGRALYIQNVVKKSNMVTIVKFTSKKRFPKATNFYFTYFINGENAFVRSMSRCISICNNHSDLSK